MNPNAQNPQVTGPQVTSTKTSTNQGPVNNNSTQNSLEIAEIRDGIVIMNDGSFRSVIMVKSINFDLMSQEEQESVEYSYQGFLNSLYFPIQIFVRSQRIDLRPYIDGLITLKNSEENMLLSLLMEDYINYINILGEQANIMDKNMYVIIPFFSTGAQDGALSQSKGFVTGVGKLFSKKTIKTVVDETALERAKTELRNRVQAVISGLQQCGVQGLPLDSQELIELYYDSYNPDTATRQHLPDFKSISTDMIIKASGKNTITNNQGTI